MTEEKRRLAAIMFTDLVGYSALSEANEALAIDLLDQKREIIEAHLKNHSGRVIKSTGDGFLIEFESALQAVRYANVVQSAIAQRNSSVDPERQFEIRIGIHLGDIVYKDDDVYGEGVNIAARIEPLAEPGGTAISEQVYNLVHNKIPVGFLSVGSPELKNIETPIEVFHVVEPGVPGVTKASERKRRRRPDDGTGKRRPLNPIVMGIGALAFALVGWFIISTVIGSDRVYDGPVTIEAIAVLPLENLGPNEEDEYFSDGMTEEILNNLAQLEDIRVISRTSVFKLKGTELSLQEIGRRLNVDHVLEGSVRRSGEEVRITVKMVRVADDRTIWSQDYDRTLENTFVVQDEIAQAISDRIEVDLSGLATTPDENPEESVDPEAYELYLKGRFYLNKRHFEGFQQARNYFMQATETDPEFAEAHAGLADTHSLMATYGYLSGREGFDLARRSAERALELNENLAEALTSLAFVLSNDEENLDQSRAEELYLKAIEVNPNYATAHHWYALLLSDLGRDDESLEQIEIALSLDPLSPIINVAAGNRYVVREDYDRARAYFEQALEVDPLFVGAKLGVVQLNALNDEFATAEADSDALAEERPNDVRVQVNRADVKMFLWKWEEAEQAFRDAISLEEGPLLEAEARTRYAALLALTGRTEDALQQIDRAIELNPDSPYNGAVRTLYYGQNLFTEYPTNDRRIIEAMQEIRMVDEDSGEALSNLEIASTHLFEGYVYAFQENYSEAIDMANRAESLVGPGSQTGDELSKALVRSIIGLRGIIYAKMGDRDRAQEVLDKLIEIKGYTGIPYSIALIYVYLNEYDEAFQWLQVGVAQRDIVLANMVYDPILEPLRSDPRYEELLREINLWERYQNHIAGGN